MSAVRVEETRVLATQRGTEWWDDFYRLHHRSGRITIVSHSLGGMVCDVACDDVEHANWLVAHMESEGIPKAGLKVLR